MSLPLELQKLPPQALDVIRYLNGKENGASVDAIMEGTGLSERSMGKAIRRLVTRYYASMSGEGTYSLTRLGQQAAEELRQYDGTTPLESAPSASVPPAPTIIPSAPASVPPESERIEIPAAVQPKTLHVRRLSVLMAQEFVVGASAMLMIGFDGPTEEATPLPQAAHVMIRVSAPGCDVDPVERPLEVAVDKPVGPAHFRIKARREETVRVKIEVFQLASLHDLRLVGGMYFDMSVSLFPTIKSAELRAVGAMVQLDPGV